MDIDTIRRLCALNNDFYRENAASFSQSRQLAWPGWERVADALEPGALLDIACGNLRFERFLDKRCGSGAFEFTCLDSSSCLAGGAEGVDFVEYDVIEALLSGGELPAARAAFDSVVSFGFMHHVPTHGLRVALAREMVACTRPGGAIALSFWRFADEANLAAKAQNTTSEGCRALGIELDEGDYLLGWNDVQGAYRYCHSFSDDEVTALVEAMAGVARVEDRFGSDGRTGALNAYLVLRRL